ncbi:MAG: zinc ABC transporter substrate-binding protein [Oscillibacter sp.]|nr:zinc ABC transporter substrate-binding protein [Oscillibacter sp.]
MSVSILPQKYFTERIAQDFAEVNVMIPPGMNPATCDLNSGQLKKLYDSDICFSVGYLPFETTHLYPVLKNKPEILLVRHSEGLELIEGSCGHSHAHSHKSVDPHIWLSPAYAKHISQQILETLSRKYPDKEEFFKANYRELEKDIDTFAQEAEKILAAKKNKSFLIYHPALTYFAHDYGMEQISIEDEGKEPNPTHLKNLIDKARKKEISIVFIQKQFDIQNAEAIARSTNSKIVPIDPLNENWLEEMNHLLQVFKENLSE